MPAAGEFLTVNSNLATHFDIVGLSAMLSSRPLLRSPGLHDGLLLTQLRMVLACALLLFLSPTLCRAEINIPPTDNPLVLEYRTYLSEIYQVVVDTMAEEGLKAVILGVTVEGEDLGTMAIGESMAGVPATTDMRFRIGAVSIAYMGSILMQLVDGGDVSLDDPVGKWLPQLPNADSVTLRMLINCTSGYPDYVGYEPFEEAFYGDVFRTWLPRELIETAFEQPVKFGPGEGWSYAHTNFVILGLALQQATGQPFSELMRDRILRPLGLEDTANPDTPEIMGPVLHAYTSERGRYEESTFWNPSWTLAQGAVMTSNLRDTLTSARSIGRGARLSGASFSEMLAPDTAGFAHWTPETYYGLGVVVNKGWIAQNPIFHGFAGVMAYLPDRDMAIVVFSTKTEESDPDVNSSALLFKRLTQILAPDHAID
jgi:CubicO group peptidase (beta-lactamase class C family)